MPLTRLKKTAKLSSNLNAPEQERRKYYSFPEFISRLTNHQPESNRIMQTRDGPRSSLAVVLCQLIADRFLFPRSSPVRALALSASPTSAAAAPWTYD